MQGQLKADALSWSDDDAGRRAVMTRNQVSGGNAPRPAGGPPAPAAPPQPARGGPMPPQGAPPGYNPSMSTMHQGQGQYPVPQQAPVPPVKSYVALFAGALGVVGLLSILAVALFTRWLWPKVKLECEPPGAAVLVDGKRLAVRAPLEVPLRPYAQHTIEFQADGYRTKKLDKPIELGYLGRGEFATVLEKLKHSVHVSPVPGQVTLNGRVIATGTDIELPDIDVKSRVMIKVEAAGYKSWGLEFDLGAQVPEAIDVPLSKN
jgi:hypothetical protein